MSHRFDSRRTSIDMCRASLSAYPLHLAFRLKVPVTLLVRFLIRVRAAIFLLAHLA